MLLIDAHIHIHECFNIENFLKSAIKNFKLYSPEDSFQGILCLTESENVSVFNNLIVAARKDKIIGELKIELTKSPNMLKIISKDNIVFVIAGRQIVTKENLEVLALGLNENYSDGNPINTVLDDITAKKTIAVIPWGFGKWTGKRKEIVENLVLQNNTIPFYLGDNGNRPWFIKPSDMFSSGIAKGIFNLPGSDPLPFKREEKKPGSFGFMINNTLNEMNPYDSFYQLISACNNQYKLFGKLESGFHFLKNQFAMQIVKRTRNK